MVDMEMTKKERVQLQKDMALAIARKHNMEMNEFDHIFWEEHGTRYRVKVKRNSITQERFSPGRNKWVRIGSYHIKRINMEKWEKFISSNAPQTEEATNDSTS